MKLKYILCLVLAQILLISSPLFASDLSKCIKSYCRYSCNTVTSCGFQAQSEVPECKSSCSTTANSSLGSVKKSDRLKTCKNAKSRFKDLSCDQIGNLIAGNGGGGGTKRSLLPDSAGIILGEVFE